MVLRLVLASRVAAHETGVSSFTADNYKKSHQRGVVYCIRLRLSETVYLGVRTVHVRAIPTHFDTLSFPLSRSTIDLVCIIVEQHCE